MPISAAEAEEEDKQNGLITSPFFIGKGYSMGSIVITGGSRGIGAAAVELFAARGDRVVFLYEKNHEAAKAVAEKTGSEAICCDVADGKAVKAAFEAIGDVDILICNAGIMHFGLLSMMEESAWDRIFM